MTTDDYETELTGSREELAAVLSGVTDGLLAGSIRLGDGADALAVDLPEDLSLEVELETEGDEVSLELELEWPADDAAVESLDAAAQAADAGEDTADSIAATDADTVGDTDGAADAEADAAADADADAVEAVPDSLVAAAAPIASLARFEVFQDSADEYRWRLRHRNGNVIATSGEGYTREFNARKGLQSVVRNAPGAVVTEESD